MSENLAAIGFHDENGDYKIARRMIERQQHICSIA